MKKNVIIVILGVVVMIVGILIAILLCGVSVTKEIGFVIGALLLIELVCYGAFLYLAHHAADDENLKEERVE